MSIFNQIEAIILIIFGIYLLINYLKRTPKYSIQEEDLKPYLSQMDIQIEETVRKQWLISFLIYTVSSAFVIFLKYIGVITLNEVGKETGNPYSIIFDIVFSSILWVLITYHCSYKKRGTAWLLLIMI